MIDKKEILKKRTKLKCKEFESKTLDGTVRFRIMTAAGAYAVDSNRVAIHEDGTRAFDMTYIRQAMIAYSMMDKDDKLIWDAQDIRGAISELPRDVIDELASFAFEMNPPVLPDENEKEKLEKNQQGSSSSD